MIKANRRSALIPTIGLAIGLLGSFAGQTYAASDDLNTPVPVIVPPAADSNPSNSATEPATENQVTPPGQANDSDPVQRDNAAAQPPSAAPPASDTPAPRPAPVAAAGGEHSVWDETSLIGKIFIGFGALLTIASAARMFMA